MEDSLTATLTLESSAAHLRRRNSIATSVVLPKNKLTVPADRRLQRSSFTALPNDVVQARLYSSELDQLSPESSSFISYTSLKDLLPSATPPPSSGYDISIRNRLVKQAAWAYLQPMSSSPTSSTSSPCFLRLFLPYLNYFYRRLTSGICWIFHRISRAIWPQ